MKRPGLAALLFVFTAGCGSPMFPERYRVGGPTATEYFHLALVGLVVAVVAYFVVARRGRAAEGVAGSKRVLFLVVVVSVTTVGVLVCRQLLGSRLDYLAIRVLASAAAVGWGSFLLMRFLSALVERPSFETARVGALLAVLPVPLALVGIWTEFEDAWLWRLVATFALLAAVATHATYLALLKVPASQRWLVTVTRGLAIAVALVHLAVLWRIPDLPEGYGPVLGGLFAATLTGTILVEMCSRHGQMTAGGAPPPPAPALVRYCIACGSTRVVSLPDSARCEDCGTQFRAELRPVSDV